MGSGTANLSSGSVMPMARFISAFKSSIYPQWSDPALMLAVFLTSGILSTANIRTVTEANFSPPSTLLQPAKAIPVDWGISGTIRAIVRGLQGIA